MIRFQLNSIKTASKIIVLGASLFLSAGSAVAKDHQVVINSKTTKNSISVVNGYVRATIPGTEISSAYMTIENTGKTAKILTSVSGDISSRIEMHEHTMADGMMKMRQVDKIEVAAQGKTLLQPSGLHIMIFNLAKPLLPETEVTLTLHFTDGENEFITLPVEKMKIQRHHH